MGNMCNMMYVKLSCLTYLKNGHDYVIIILFKNTIGALKMKMRRGPLKMSYCFMFNSGLCKSFLLMSFQQSSYVMSLCRYVIVSLCHCVVVSLCHCVLTSSCHELC